MKKAILIIISLIFFVPQVYAITLTEASIVVAEMVANQLSDFLLKGVKINTV